MHNCINIYISQQFFKLIPLFMGSFSFGHSVSFGRPMIFAMLRPLKGVMIALQFQHNAEEGRLAEDSPEQ